MRIDRIWDAIQSREGIIRLPNLIHVPCFISRVRGLLVLLGYRRPQGATLLQLQTAIYSRRLPASVLTCKAQESPYVVTYDHYLEEPGNLEIEYFSTFGTQLAGNDFHAFWAEFEYGATAWWTTEVYLDGQTTFGDSTLFTGFRWENRFRLLQREHFINPVLYLEYEQTSGADKILKEVEGHDVESDYAVPNALARKEHDHELELKLLLSKTFAGWNIALNPLATKNLTGGNPWEFGYAIGASRPLGLKASVNRCSSAERISSQEWKCMAASVIAIASVCTTPLTTWHRS